MKPTMTQEIDPFAKHSCCPFCQGKWKPIIKPSVKITDWDNFLSDDDKDWKVCSNAECSLLMLDQSSDNYKSRYLKKLLHIESGRKIYLYWVFRSGSYWSEKSCQWNPIRTYETL